jgi:2-polyprenyl-3-methyl-5-hydroxy-6-metoxy-1,4-benzoquinol methylase
VSEPASSLDPAYTERLAASVAPRTGWRRVVDPQRPYRWNIRRLAQGRVLDVGCGVGRNLAHLDGRGVGIDPNVTSLDVARARGLEVFTPAEFRASVHGSGRRFDTVVFAHVLEHLDRDEATRLVATHLADVRVGGIVIVICPQQRGQASDPTHVTFVDAALARQILDDAGAEPVRSTSFPLPAWAGRWFTHNETVVVGRVRG